MRRGNNFPVKACHNYYIVKKSERIVITWVDSDLLTWKHDCKIQLLAISENC